MRRLAMIVVALGLAVGGAMTAPAASAAPAYEVAIVAGQVGGSPTTYRITVATGLVVTVGTLLVPTVDAGPLPPGDYHLFVTETPDNKTYWLYRMDSQSGRMWFLNANSWGEIQLAK